MILKTIKKLTIISNQQIYHLNPHPYKMGHNVLLKALTLCTNSRAVKQKFFDFYQPQCMFAASFFSHPYLRCPVHFLKQLFFKRAP